eukprot:CAMPEP_0194341752 /NCGR_PEP_ID=MMETSP0171-20130528/90645_1 /TAXON_ID=218684 /ORGANISM="Corethron pennatum, Strain L29A3" /LENGTH=236 /DNA_ID=CAMNT_0039107207 /DNA_START=152 /DNA_END=858 /DNA_ORIENTATION=-
MLRKATPAIHLQEFDYFAPGYHYSQTTVRADVQDIPLNDESFEGVIILHVLEHVPNLEKALRELSRVLKGGGFVHHETPCYHDVNSLIESSSLKNGLKPPPQFTGQVQNCTKSRIEDEKPGICRQKDHLFGYTCNYLRESFEKYGFECIHPNITPAIAQRYGLVAQINRFRCVKKWDNSADFTVMDWEELHVKAQEQARLLGFNEKLWDEDLPNPIFSKPFQDLGAEKKAAVIYLG